MKQKFFDLVCIHICVWSCMFSLSFSIARVVFLSLHVVCWSFVDGWRILINRIIEKITWFDPRVRMLELLPVIRVNCVLSCEVHHNKNHILWVITINVSKADFLRCWSHPFLIQWISNLKIHMNGMFSYCH